jgi:3-phosphoshikimate 1-carboxyvinyltransferase
MGVVSAMPVAATFTGDASLSRRPMRRVARPLTEMGARFEFPAGRDGLPLTVHGGSLRPLDWTLESTSAQVKSALLLAGVRGCVAVTLREPAPSRDHTERMLRYVGVDVRTGDGRIMLHPAERLASIAHRVPGDPSAAAFFAALGALAADGHLVLRGVGLNPGRTGFIDVLRRMGARLEIVARRDEGPEPVGDLLAGPGPLRGTVIEGREIPALIDELPMLACVAARAEGETVIEGAEELRVKESDRIAAVVANLRAIGVDADERPDGMRITGSDRPLHGRIVTHGDHRLAMAFGVLSMVPGTSIDIDDRACVGVSNPGFWTDLAHVAS